MEWIARGVTPGGKGIMESKLIKDFKVQHRLNKLKKLQLKQRLKIALTIGGIIICLMLIMTS